ncbi:MAG: hypothetical protein JHC95_17110 [Solirubrobacteraceae bacterium]|nr:hypothetical protein [Solirubrobacteraceae bacterium]
MPTPRLVPIVLITLLVLPGSAAASEVSSSGATVGGTAGINALAVSEVAGKLRFSDNAPGAVMTPGSGCTAVSAWSADCDLVETGTILVGLQGSPDTFFAASLDETQFLVNGGDGDDQFFLGGGDDFLAGAGGNDTANGGEGADTFQDTAQILFGVELGSGNDTFNGEGGNDIFPAGANHTVDGNGIGMDKFNGGPGFDTADYSARTAPLAITVGAGVGSSSANDGAAGEKDDIITAERVLGGSAADAITAGPVGSVLVGGPGADTLTGGSAGDQLFGGTEADATGSGDDTLDGAGGADVLRGGDGTDTATYATRAAAVIASLDDIANDGAAGEQDNIRTDVENLVGGSGPDTLTGSDGRNVLDGGPGGDTILARDGQTDTVVCGSGTDSVVADAADVVAADCESVDQPAAPGPVTIVLPGEVVTVPGSGQPTGALRVTLGGGTLKADRRGRIKIAVRCPAQTAACTGTLALRSGKRTIATKPFKVAPGKTATVTFTLSKALRAKLRRAKKLKLGLTATSTGPIVSGALTVKR